MAVAFVCILPEGLIDTSTFSFVQQFSFILYTYIYTRVPIFESAEKNSNSIQLFFLNNKFYCYESRIHPPRNVSRSSVPVYCKIEYGKSNQYSKLYSLAMTIFSFLVQYAFSFLLCLLPAKNLLLVSLNGWYLVDTHLVRCVTGLVTPCSLFVPR